MIRSGSGAGFTRAISMTKDEAINTPGGAHRWDVGIGRSVEVAVAGFAVGHVAIRLGKRNADEARQYLAKVHVSEVEAGWSGVGNLSGHAADVCYVVEGRWGGCSYPVGADGQYGGRERKRVRGRELRTEVGRRSQIGISRHSMTAQGVLEC